MRKPVLALCRYPTKVLFVDDNKSFLSAVKLATASRIYGVAHHDPIKGLEYVNSYGLGAASHLSASISSKKLDGEGRIQHLFNAAVRTPIDQQRFAEVSVVVVDYDMPDINGLDFCLRIKNPHIKKILLTGHAGADEAVQAFNDGLINYYISKADARLFEKLLEVIAHMQAQYFVDVSSAIKLQVVDHNKSLFCDEVLSDYLAKIVAEHKISEYYFSTHPTRYELRSANGQASWLLIYSRDELNEHIRIIKEEAGPTWLIEQLGTGLYVPYFPSSDGFYDQELGVESTQLYPAEVLEGLTRYYCCHVARETQAISMDSVPKGGAYH